MMRLSWKWLALAGTITLAVVVVGLLVNRQARLGRLERECAIASRISDWPRLEQLSREWLDSQSTPAGWFWLGKSLKGQGQFLEADAAFGKIPLEGTRGIDAAVERMEIQFHVRQQPLPAIELARQLLALDPRLQSPRRHIIHYYLMTLQRPELLKEIHLAIQTGADLPEHYVYLLMLEELSFVDAERVTAAWSKHAPESLKLKLAPWVHRLRHARSEILYATPLPQQVEQYKQMVRQETAKLQEFREEPIVLELLLLLALDESNVLEVERLLALVPDSLADDPVFWRYRGWYAVQVGDDTEAQRSYKETLRLNPLARHGRHEYANLLRRVGNIREATRIQAIAATGTDISRDIRRLSHVQKISPVLLRRLSDYANACEEYTIATAIRRRFAPGAP